MVAIPQVLPSDPEDVVWALQTAEALWKRAERADAIVWLRRAAQAAGEAEQDERALHLSKLAAELTDLIAEEKAPSTVTQAAAPIAEAEGDTEILVETDEPVSPGPASPGPASPGAVSPGAVSPPAPSFPLPKPKGPPPLPPRARPPALPGNGAKVSPPAIPPVAPSPPARPAASGAAEEKTDIMKAPRRTDSGRFAAVPPIGSMPEVVEMPADVPSVDVRESLAPVSVTDSEAEVVTLPPGSLVSSQAPRISEARAEGPSAEQAPAESRTPEGGAQIPTPVVPPPDSPALPAPIAPPSFPGRMISRSPSLTDIDALAGLPPLRDPEDSGSSESALAALDPVAAPPREERVALDEQNESRDPNENDEQDDNDESDENDGSPNPEPQSVLAIDDFEAFADLPDDLRETLQKSAFVMYLREGAEIPSFALAIVLAGDVDVAAHGVAAPAVRLPTGHVLYGRGSIDADVPMRLLGTGSGSGTEVAVWSRDDVAPLMKSCPWVEDDLRAAADPVIAAVGVTLGSFGMRLDPTLRGIVTARLAVHSLSAGDVLFPAGRVVPGLFVVGAGKIELAKDGVVTETLGPGDFIYPTAVMGGGTKAQAEARAAETGALVLSCDRKAAQELLMTCPPLLEVLASL